jgi:hypothetical protein
VRLDVIEGYRLRQPEPAVRDDHGDRLVLSCQVLPESMNVAGLRTVMADLHRVGEEMFAPQLATCVFPAGPFDIPTEDHARLAELDEQSHGHRVVVGMRERASETSVF